MGSMAEEAIARVARAAGENRGAEEERRRRGERRGREERTERRGETEDKM